jgi:hypothetical protein
VAPASRGLEGRAAGIGIGDSYTPSGRSDGSSGDRAFPSLGIERMLGFGVAGPLSGALNVRYVPTHWAHH